MPDPQQTDWNEVFASDSFKNLPPTERATFVKKYVPGYASLPPREQVSFLEKINPHPTGDTTPPEGFWGAIWHDVEGAAKGIGEMGVHPYAEAYAGYKHGGAKEAAVRGLMAVTPGAESYKTAIDLYAQNEREKKLGPQYGPGYRVAAGIAKATGVMDPQAMEDAAQRGDKSAVFGHTVVPIATAVAPLAAEGLGELAGKARPMESLQGGARAAGAEDVFRATAPGAGSHDFKLRDNVELAANDLAEIQRKTPLEGAGGIWNPDKRLRNFAGNVSDYMGDLWEKQVMPQISRWGKVQVDVRPLKQAMLDTITQTDIESNPAGVKQIQRWAERMPDTDTLAGMAERRKTINAYLRSFEEKSASDQAAAMKTKPLVEALKAQDRAIQKQMFGELARRGEPGIDKLEQRYAALADLRDAARSQMNDAEKFRLFSQMRFYLSPSNLFGAREHITAAPSGGRLMARGLKRIESSGAEAPAVTGPGSALPAPPSRMLPPAGGSSPSGPETVGRPAGQGPSTRRQIIEAPGETPTQALAKRPGTAPTTTLPSSGRRLGGSPFTPTLPRAENPRRMLPPPPTGASEPVAPYRKMGPMRQLDVLGGDVHAAESTPKESPQFARIVKVGGKRRLEIWSDKHGGWIPTDWPLSGKP